MHAVVRTGQEDSCDDVEGQVNPGIFGLGLLTATFVDLEKDVRMASGAPGVSTYHVYAVLHGMARTYDADG